MAADDELSHAQRLEQRKQRLRDMYAQQWWFERMFDQLSCPMLLGILLLVAALGAATALLAEGKLGAVLGLELPPVELKVAILFADRSQDEFAAAGRLRTHIRTAFRAYKLSLGQRRRATMLVDLLHAQGREDGPALAKRLSRYSLVVLLHTGFAFADGDAVAQALTSYLDTRGGHVVFTGNTLAEQHLLCDEPVDCEPLQRLLPASGWAPTLLDGPSALAVDQPDHPLLHNVSLPSTQCTQCARVILTAKPSAAVLARWSDGNLPLLLVSSSSDVVALNLDPLEQSVQTRAAQLLFNAALQSVGIAPAA